MEKRLLFYKNNIASFISDKNAKILIVAGAKNDAMIFHQLGFTNVLITNIKDIPKEDLYGYPFQKENALSLNFEENTFDYVIISAALHHLSEPHKGLTEVVRVAKFGAIIIESLDNWLMRLLVKLKLAEELEHSAVLRYDGKAGGVNNTETPNYVYRWTKREIEKTIKAYKPLGKYKFIFRHQLVMPYNMEMANKWYFNLMNYILDIALLPFPSQKNLFFAYIGKHN